MADTSMIIPPVGQPSGQSTIDPANVTTEVTESNRVVSFYNISYFQDNRSDGVQRTLKMKVKATGDVTSQTPTQTLSYDYYPPYSRTFNPETDVTIADTGAGSHQILVQTEYKVLIKSTGAPDHSMDLGEYTTVDEK